MAALVRTSPALRKELYAYLVSALTITEVPLVATIVWFSDHRLLSLASGLFFPVFSGLMFKLSEKLNRNLEKWIMLGDGLNVAFIAYVSGPRSPGWLEGVVYLTAVTYLVPETGWKVVFMVSSVASVTAISAAIGKPLQEVVGLGLALSAYGWLLFRTLRVVIRKNEQIEDLLLNIFPRSIADELQVHKTVASVFHPDVTVLFTDFSGFTAAAAKMTPGEVVTDLDACFTRFDQIIDRRGLEKLKTIGDSYMCAGGIPGHNTTHAIDSALAAIEIRETMRQLQEQRSAAGQATWQLRIGLHSGPVVAGVIGQKRFAYDIWGDTVNTASRMESAGQPGEINVSAELFARLEPWFIGEARGKVAAKGKGELEMVFLRRLRPELSANAAGTEPNEEFAKRRAALATAPAPPARTEPTAAPSGH